ncbi:2-oxoglutaramate amidase [Methyloligella halotolerans]|uniref:2-oxoglutaramate amidase n=1 Tax=Methyloligella halotolerans TaxID=1177755 RepID=A0A1E2RYP8_9HYPH|nr:carbon-nitrogen hydrolase family protein [Methyloligella halotolerans]ODA67341.1 2-oxoglutaramate amidase [Methyloligella halotolerans]
MTGDTPERFRAALVQLRSGRSILPNLEAAEALIRRAASEGADYIQTPENTALMELDKPLAFAQAEEEQESRPLQRMRELACELGIWLHVGSIAMKVAADKLANRSFLIAPSGEIAARYDKLHMFDVDLPNGEVYRESETYRPGSKAVLASLPWGDLGLTICYDLRFPALYRALAEAGASFLAIPSAFTRETGRAHWRTLVRARAIETGCFVFAATQGGYHEMGRWTHGHSMIVSPWGDVLAEAGEAPQIVIADIDPVEVVRARQAVPSLSGSRDFELEIHRPEPVRAAS